MCTAAVPAAPPPTHASISQCRFKAYYAQVRRQDPYETKADKEVQAISLNVGLLAEQYIYTVFSSHSEVFSPEVVWAHHL